LDAWVSEVLLRFPVPVHFAALVLQFQKVPGVVLQWLYVELASKHRTVVQTYGDDSIRLDSVLLPRVHKSHAK